MTQQPKFPKNIPPLQILPLQHSQALKSNLTPEAKEFNPAHLAYNDSPDPFSKVAKNIQPMIKPSVQKRLAVVKRSISREDEKTFQPEEKTTVNDVPLEWWATENMSVIVRLEQYCVLKQLPPPNYTYFKVREGKLYKFQCRVTIEDSTYSTYPEDFETKDKAKIVCAARAVESIKLRQSMTQYPLFDGDNTELACKIYDIIRTHNTGVFLAEIPNLFR